jgi:hypothetical protein
MDRGTWEKYPSFTNIQTLIFHFTNVGQIESQKNSIVVLEVYVWSFENLLEDAGLLWRGGLRAPVTRRAMLVEEKAPGRATLAGHVKG